MARSLVEREGALVRITGFGPQFQRKKASVQDSDTAEAEVASLREQVRALRELLCDYVAHVEAQEGTSFLNSWRGWAGDDYPAEGLEQDRCLQVKAICDDVERLRVVDDATKETP